MLNKYRNGKIWIKFSHFFKISVTKEVVVKKVLYKNAWTIDAFLANIYNTEEKL